MSTGDAAMDSFLATFDPGVEEQAMLEFLADDVVVTDWMTPDEELRGKAQVLERFYAPIIESFPDVYFEVFDARRAGDALLVCGFFTGTFTCDYMGFPAHGRRVRWE